MSKLTLIAITLVNLALPAVVLRADEASHRAAAERLLANLKVEQNHAATLDNLLQAQVRQNPKFLQVQVPLREFFNKHLGWASLKPELLKLYVETFTEEELGQLSAFYESEIGRKSQQLLPTLYASAMKFAQGRMQQHLPELQNLVRPLTEGQGPVAPK